MQAQSVNYSFNLPAQEKFDGDCGRVKSKIGLKVSDVFVFSEKPTLSINMVLYGNPDIATIPLEQLKIGHLKTSTYMYDYSSIMVLNVIEAAESVEELVTAYQAGKINAIVDVSMRYGKNNTLLKAAEIVPVQTLLQLPVYSLLNRRWLTLMLDFEAALMESLDQNLRKNSCRY